MKFKTLSDFAKQNFNENSAEIEYTRAYLIKSDKYQDEAMKNAADESAKCWYAVIGRFFGGGSCIDVCSDALKAGGFDPGIQKKKDTVDGEAVYAEDYSSPIPNERYDYIVKNNAGTDITKSITPTKETRKERERQTAKEQADQFVRDQRAARNSVLD